MRTQERPLEQWLYNLGNRVGKRICFLGVWDGILTINQLPVPGILKCKEGESFISLNRTSTEGKDDHGAMSRTLEIMLEFLQLGITAEDSIEAKSKCLCGKRSQSQLAKLQCNVSAFPAEAVVGFENGTGCSLELSSDRPGQDVCHKVSSTGAAHGRSGATCVIRGDGAQIYRSSRLRNSRACLQVGRQGQSRAFT